MSTKQTKCLNLPEQVSKVYCMSDSNKYYREKAGKEDWELLGKVVQF